LSQVPDAKLDGSPPEATPSSERWVAPDQDLIPRAVADALNEEALPRSDSATSQDPDKNPVIAGQLRAPRRWERLLVESAVIGGRERWRKRIDGFAKELRSRIAEIDDENEASGVATRRTLQDLEAFADYALPLIDILADLPKTANWGEWLDRLGALATRALRQPERILSVLSELSPMAPVGPVALNDILNVVSDLLLQVGVPPPAQRYGAVFVGPVDAARGMSFDSVFILGLAERLFPQKIVEEPMLLDSLRAELSDGLATNAQRLSNERLALCIAGGAAERRLILSYPRLDLQQARPRVPSFYALEAMRAAEGRLPNFAELDRRAEAESSTRIGWPAPADPLEAIDHAEYDLAVLDRFLKSDQGQTQGTARYLLTTNTYLGRALRTRWQRWSDHRWTPADGLIKPSAPSRAAIAKHALDMRSYSPTALQHYAECPYKFFLQAIHRLAPREVPEAIDELDPLQRGALIHEIQFDRFARLSEAKLLPVSRQNLDTARQMLDKAIEQVAGQFYADLAPAIDRVWEDGVDAIRVDLREWLRRASEDDSGYVPWRFELSFGLSGEAKRQQADTHSSTAPVDLDCGIQLRGSIDLVERHASGHVRISDHKTGKADGEDGQVIAGGRTLQPALYALVAEKLFRGELKVDCGRLYFCTSAGGFTEVIVPLDRYTRDSITQLAAIIGEALQKPFLPAAPAERQCAWCDYQPICGPYEELRTRRKAKEPLASLLKLRDMP
jgi:RecB family exonuclease